MKSSKEKTTALLMIGVLIASLLPVVVIAFYNYPSADDFGFSAFSHIVWEETHSICAVIKQAFLTTLDRYVNWQGTFSTIFIMALQPAIFATELYALVPFIMIGSLVFSTLYFLRTLFRDCLKCDNYCYISVAMLILMISIQCAISKVQGFFWFNGATHYLLPYCWMLTQCSLSFQYLFLNKSRKKEKVIIGLMCFLSILLGGANYVTALQSAILFVSLLLFLILSKKISDKKSVLLPMCIFFIAFLVNAIAPGNQIRGAGANDTPGVIESILLSFKECFLQVFVEWTDWTTVLFILFLLPSCIYLVKQVKLTFSFPLIPMLFSFCILSSMFTPTLFAMGNNGAGRIHNIIYFTYILLLFLNLFYIVGWCNKKGMVYKIKYARIVYILSLFILIVFCFTKYIIPDKDYALTTSVVRSLVNGEAREYKNIMEERLVILEGSELEVVLPTLNVFPHVLFFNDIGTDSNDWRNNIMCRYYQKKSISTN